MHDMAAEQIALVRVKKIEEAPPVTVGVAEGGGAFAAGGGALVGRLRGRCSGGDGRCAQRRRGAVGRAVR